MLYYYIHRWPFCQHIFSKNFAFFRKPRFIRIAALKYGLSCHFCRGFAAKRDEPSQSSLRGGQHPRPLSQILRICQLSQRESHWRNRRLCNLPDNFPSMPRALPLGELSPQVTERARMLAGGALNAPPSGNLAATIGNRLRGLPPRQGFVKTVRF